jgi:hypothetical protein
MTMELKVIKRTEKRFESDPRRWDIISLLQNITLVHM